MLNARFSLLLLCATVAHSVYAMDTETLTINTSPRLTFLAGIKPQIVKLVAGTIILESTDDHRKCELPRTAAQLSQTITHMIDDSSIQQPLDQQILELQVQVNGETILQVGESLKTLSTLSSTGNYGHMLALALNPLFIQQPYTKAISVLLAANYLDIDPLLKYIRALIASEIIAHPHDASKTTALIDALLATNNQDVYKAIFALIAPEVNSVPALTKQFAQMNEKTRNTVPESLHTAKVSLSLFWLPSDQLSKVLEALNPFRPRTISSSTTNMALESADNKSFNLPKNAAELSHTMAAFIREMGTDAPVTLYQLKSEPLSRIVDCLKTITVIPSSTQHYGQALAEQLNSLFTNKTPQQLIDVLVAADYLNIPILVKYLAILITYQPDTLYLCTGNFAANPLSTFKAIPCSI